MSDSEKLEQLLDRWEEAQDQGTPLLPETLCRDCPELLDELKRRIQGLDRVNHFLEPTLPRENGHSVEAALSGARYHPLRFHARGGLGDVYVAEDVELHREVALKCLRAGQLADRFEQDRFLVEAEITGRLEHPGVVPVYGLGWDAGGQPYYAMRFIRGQTLVDAIKAFHASEKSDTNGERDVAFQKLLRSFLSICQTVAYAHSRGVIHRDIKPGNIMLGPYGETLLVDWGLAKLLGVPEGSSEYSLRWRRSAAMRLGEPEDGVVKGSPAYMSPEQATGKGDEVEPTSDVYSLGATLYAILTGRPPVTGPIEQVLERVKAGLFPQPRAVRPSVPPALEAICLKAMRRHPDDRYVSAAALAADIERWLAGEPVSAWREPLAVRGRRWLKRHRTLVTASAAVIVVGGLILTGATMLLAAKTVELTQANQNESAARDDERQAKELAQGKEKEAIEQRRQAEAQRDAAQRNVYRADMNIVSHSLVTGNADRARRILNNHLPEPGEHDYRRFEWYHFWRLLQMEKNYLRAPDTTISCAVFSPRSRTTLATGCLDGSVLIWDTAERRITKTFKDQMKWVSSIAYSPDGTRLALADPQGPVKLLDISSGRVTELIDAARKFDHVAWSPNGKMVAAGGNDGWIDVWDTTTNLRLASFVAHTLEVSALCFSPDSTVLTSAGVERPKPTDDKSGTVRLWVVGTWNEGNHFDLRQSLSAAIAFTPDGSRLVIGPEYDAPMVLDPSKASQQAVWLPGAGMCRSLAVSPDASWLAVGYNTGTIELRKLDEPSKDIRRIFYSHDNLRSLTFSNDSQTLAVLNFDGQVGLWDLKRSDEPPYAMGYAEAVNGLSVSQDSQLIATADLNGNITLRNANGERVRGWFTPHKLLTMLALSPDGSMLAGVQMAGVLTLWDTKDGHELASLKPGDPRLFSVAFSPDGRLLAAGGTAVRIWDVNSRELLATWNVRNTGVESLIFSPDGKTLAASRGSEGTVWLWDVAAQKEKGSIATGLQQVSGLAFSPDSKTLAVTAYEGRVQLWDVDSRQMRVAVKGHWGWISSVAFAPDGKTLATVAPAPGEGLVKLWDAQTLEERASFQDLAGIIRLVFTPDGRTMIAGCYDKTVKMWRTASDADVYEDCQRLLKQEPNDATRQTDLVLACWAYARELQRTGDNDKARQVLEEGQAQLQRLREKSPDDPKKEKWSREFDKALQNLRE